MDNITSIDDGYRVVFANTTKDDWVDQATSNEERKGKGNIKKIRSFVFPAKYYDQTIKTAEELVKEIKPHASIV